MVGKVSSLKAAIYSFGVVMVWLWCAGATCVPALRFFYGIQHKRWNDLWIAVVLEVVILAAGYGYPLFVAHHYEKAFGKRAWFRPIALRSST